MARVCHLQGVVVIQDLIVSEFPARAAYQNRFEQLRDTSHTRALPLSELLALFTACGLGSRASSYRSSDHAPRSVAGERTYLPRTRSAGTRADETG